MHISSTTDPQGTTLQEPIGTTPPVVQTTHGHYIGQSSGQPRRFSSQEGRPLGTVAARAIDRLNAGPRQAADAPLRQFGPTADARRRQHPPTRQAARQQSFATGVHDSLQTERRLSHEPLLMRPVAPPEGEAAAGETAMTTTTTGVRQPGEGIEMMPVPPPPEDTPATVIDMPVQTTSTLATRTPRPQGERGHGTSLAAGMASVAVPSSSRQHAGHQQVVIDVRPASGQHATGQQAVVQSVPPGRATRQPWETTAAFGGRGPRSSRLTLGTARPESSRLANQGRRTEEQRVVSTPPDNAALVRTSSARSMNVDTFSLEEPSIIVPRHDEPAAPPAPVGWAQRLRMSAGAAAGHLIYQLACTTSTRFVGEMLGQGVLMSTWDHPRAAKAVQALCLGINALRTGHLINGSMRVAPQRANEAFSGEARQPLAAVPPGMSVQRALALFLQSGMYIASEAFMVMLSDYIEHGDLNESDRHLPAAMAAAMVRNLVYGTTRDMAQASFSMASIGTPELRAAAAERTGSYLTQTGLIPASLAFSLSYWGSGIGQDHVGRAIGGTNSRGEPVFSAAQALVRGIMTAIPETIEFIARTETTARRMRQVNQNDGYNVHWDPQWVGAANLNVVRDQSLNRVGLYECLAAVNTAIDYGVRHRTGLNEVQRNSVSRAGVAASLALLYPSVVGLWYSWGVQRAADRANP